MKLVLNFFELSSYFAAYYVKFYIQYLYDYTPLLNVLIQVHKDLAGDTLEEERAYLESETLVCSWALGTTFY